MTFPTYEKNKSHVPNHQPDIVLSLITWLCGIKKQPGDLDHPGSTSADPIVLKRILHVVRGEERQQALAEEISSIPVIGWCNLYPQMVEMDRNGIGSMALGLPENHDFTLFS